jgi:hypothetical protein
MRMSRPCPPSGGIASSHVHLLLDGLDDNDDDEKKTTATEARLRTQVRLRARIAAERRLAAVAVAAAAHDNNV